MIVGLLFTLVGIFFPDKLIALLGGDAEIVAVGKNYTRIFMSFAPFFMWNYICNAFVRNDGCRETELLMENRFYGLDSHIFMAEYDVECADDVQLDDNTLSFMI